MANERISFVGLAAGHHPGLDGLEDNPAPVRQLITEGLLLIALQREMRLPSGRAFYEELQDLAARTHQEHREASARSRNYYWEVVARDVEDILSWADLRYCDHLQEVVASWKLSPRALASMLVNLAILVYRGYHPKAEIASKS